MDNYLQTLIDNLIDTWELWRNAQCEDDDCKEIVDEVFMEEYFKLDEMRDILG